MNRHIIITLAFCASLTTVALAELPVTDGLIVELRADALEGLQDGDVVTTWADLADDDAVDGTVATFGDVSEPVFAIDALNGGPAVRFDAVSSLRSAELDAGFDPDAGITIVAVCTGDRTDEEAARIAEIGPIPALGGTAVAADVSTNADHGCGFRLNNGYAVTTDSSGMTTGWHIGAWLAHQGSKHSDLVLYLDGIKQTLINNNPDNTVTLPATGNVLTVGAGFCDAWLDDRADADLAVLLVYNRVLSEVEVLAVSAYLQEEYLTEKQPAVVTDFRETLIAHWPLDEGNGRITADISGYENHGTIVNDCAWVEGTYGNAIDFAAPWVNNGDPGSSRIEADPLRLDNRSMTIAAWANPVLYGNKKTLIGQMHTANSGESLEIQYYTDGSICFTFRNSGYQIYTDAGMVESNVWHHLACVYDYPTETMKIYINGELVKEGASKPYGAVVEGRKLYIGQWNSWTYQSWRGTVDDVRFYESALTPEEIALVRDNVPAQASTAPTPYKGAGNVSLDKMLQWQAGAFGTACDVYLGTDFDDVSEATRDDIRGVLISQGQTETSLNVGLLAAATTYYWRVDMVNTADNSTLKGHVWSFITSTGIVIDDMESYNDAADLWIYNNWVDGWEDPNNGSVVGNGDLPESTSLLVYEGFQSMPMEYDNSSATLSYATMSLKEDRQNWLQGSLNALSLYYRGYGPFYGGEDTNGVISMCAGGGVALRAVEDNCVYVYQQLSGDGSISMRIDYIEYAAMNSGAYVMIRESLDAGAKRISEGMLLASGIVTGYREATNAVSTFNNPATQKGKVLPIWLKLERNGNEFHGYYAEDEAGTQWVATDWSPITLEMATDVYIGIAAASSTGDAAGRVRVSNVVTTGNVTGQRTAVVVGDPAAQPSNGPQPIYLVLKDKADQKKIVSTDADATVAGDWTQWLVPYSDLDGVDLGNLASMILGVGDPDATAPSGATGKIWIDDIRLIDSGQ